MAAKVTVKVPSRSGFDKSHQNLLTSKVGTLTPILCDEIIPNEKIDLEAAISASLPPLASDTFMRCDLKAEAFFVPTRILYGGYEKWLTGEKVWAYDIDADAGESESNVGIPVLMTPSTSAVTEAYTKAGTLFDYLGGKAVKQAGSGVPTRCAYNIFPFLAYYKIYDDWYRNTQVQKPLFTQLETGHVDNGTAYGSLTNLPYVTCGEQNADTLVFTLGSSGFRDGTKLGDLLQRNFGSDYFTCATPNPQLGDAKRVTIDIESGGTSAATGSFTISSLRAMNSLQQFAERNALGGLRLQDYVKNNYGANLSSGVAQRAIYLGSASLNVYSKGIYQTANGDGGAQNENPFSDSVGAQFGSANAAGSMRLVSDFVADEPGYLMVLVSLVPTVTYSSGLNRMLGRYNAQGSQTDMANPMLQNVGNQPIYCWELDANFYNQPDKVFGYVDRYADFKYMPDELHGLLRDGESLESFALQRSISGETRISDSFLKIPTDYLDQVAAVNGSISQYGVWIDSFFKYRVSMPLAEYAIPSLQDPAYEHGHDVDIDLRGSRI